MTRSRRRVWVVGPAAWDTVAYLDQLPAAGRYTPARRLVERPGGTAANVAQALAGTGVETGFVTRLGADRHGGLVRESLQAGPIRHLVVEPMGGPTHHVLVLVDAVGERTMVGLTPWSCTGLSLAEAGLAAGDLVVFVVWDPALAGALADAARAGCVTVVGSAALEDPLVTADLVVGSRSDLKAEPDLARDLHRFGRIVLTRGSEGAVQVEQGRTLTQPALPAEVVDTTGAGDAFLAGYLAVFAAGDEDGAAALAAGARWAAATVAVESSIPPPWSALGLSLDGEPGRGGDPAELSQSTIG